MNYILAFIAGVVFFAVVLPLLNNIVDVVEAKKQLYISAVSVKVNNNKLAIQKATNENEQSDISVIGFHYNDSEIECDDFQIEDKFVGKIGF